MILFIAPWRNYSLKKKQIFAVFYQFLRKHCHGVSIRKFLKQRHHRCFLVNLVNIFKTVLIQSICEWLFLKFSWAVLHYFVESVWFMQHTLAELVNQHRDQKQPDSEAMFLNFWTRTTSFLSRRLLQCSAWWRCKTSTRLIRKAWDMTNPYDDLFG